MKEETLRKIEQYGQLDRDVSFKSLTTFRIGGTASAVVYPRNYFSLISIINIVNEENIKYKVFGNGSNILCSDDYYDGLIIKLNRCINEFYFDDNLLTAQAGCSIISLAYKALGESLSGLEFASGIPATLGGAIYMNAGAYKSDVSEIIEEVQVLIDDQIVWLTNQQCQFSYRKSIFQSHPDWIILAAKLRLTIDDHDKIASVMENRHKRRMETQPLEYPSAGSTFRNPENNFAWQLIDSIGYRGKIIGGAKVSEKHSNFLINIGNASANDIDNLSKEIIAKVKDSYNVDLTMEVEKFNWKN